jgi:hypothetical protein
MVSKVLSRYAEISKDGLSNPKLTDNDPIRLILTMRLKFPTLRCPLRKRWILYQHWNLFSSQISVLSYISQPLYNKNGCDFMFFFFPLLPHVRIQWRIPREGWPCGNKSSLSQHTLESGIRETPWMWWAVEIWGEPFQQLAPNTTSATQLTSWNQDICLLSLDEFW